MATVSGSSAPLIRLRWTNGFGDRIPSWTNEFGDGIQRREIWMKAIKSKESGRLRRSRIHMAWDYGRD